MVKRIEISVEGNMPQVYLIQQKGLVTVVGGGIIPDRNYLATLDHIKRITTRQLKLSYQDKNLEINEY